MLRKWKKYIEVNLRLNLGKPVSARQDSIDIGMRLNLSRGHGRGLASWQGNLKRVPAFGEAGVSENAGISFKVSILTKGTWWLIYGFRGTLFSDKSIWKRNVAKETVKQQTYIIWFYVWSSVFWSLDEVSCFACLPHAPDTALTMPLDSRLKKSRAAHATIAAAVFVVFVVVLFFVV